MPPIVKMVGGILRYENTIHRRYSHQAWPKRSTNRVVPKPVQAAN